MRAILSRLRGLCLLLLAFGPPAVVVGGIAVAVALTASIVSATRDRVEAVSDMVSGQIAPQLQALRGANDGLATEAERVDVELTHTLATLSELQDLQLQPGQLGSSGPQHLQVPPQDVWIGPPVVGIKVDGGRLLDQNLPAIQIPDRPVAIPAAQPRNLPELFSGHVRSLEAVIDAEAAGAGEKASLVAAEAHMAMLADVLARALAHPRRPSP